VLALVLIVVNAVRGEPEESPGVRASTTGATPLEPMPDTEGAGPSESGRNGKKGGKGRSADSTPTDAPLALPTAPVLAEPEGACAQDDVSVTPTVRDAVAGESATIVLALRTITSAACTWEVSAESLAVRISVGDDNVWASWECPGRLQERTVVVRQAVASTYEFPWSTRRSDAGCPTYTEYAQPGDYRVTAGAYGGEPADVVFDLAAPVAEPAPEPEPETEEKGKKGRPEAEQRAPASVDEAPRAGR
jgi:hypothetical protein